MLEVVFAALLFTGCNGFPEYEKSSISDFNDLLGKPVFPAFEVIPKDDWCLKFKIIRENIFDLVFIPIGVDRQDFRYGGEIYVRLEFFALRVPDTEPEECKLIVRFKSKTTDHQWTVTSNVFTSPQTESVMQDAKRNAVFINAENSLTESLADKLCTQLNHDSRHAKINIQWILTLIKKEPPRLHFTPSDKPLQKFYLGVPAIADKKALQKLETLKRDMRDINEVTDETSTDETSTEDDSDD